jgi:addiction module HigA family antidote
MAHENFTPTHPGEVIKDELIARGISQKEFAQRIGVPYTMLNDILNERRPLSAATALYIESALGISADLLMGLQADYNMQIARNDAKVKRKMRSVTPYPSVVIQRA